MVKDDIEYFVKYWIESSPEYLTGIRVAISKSLTILQLKT